MIRGTSQNPDVYFQSREAVEPFYARFPALLDETMARFAEHARSKDYISTPSYAQVTQDIHGRAVHRWHAYREMFKPVLPILRPMMERLGYTDT